MNARARTIVLAALAVPVGPALATDYRYLNGPFDLAATPYTSADRIFLDGATATASSPVTIPASLVRLNAPSSFANDQDVTLAGTLDGTSFTKSGTAALVLAGDSPTYGGAVTLDGGTLRLASAAALVSPAIFSTASHIYLNPNATLDLNGFPTNRTLHYNGGALVNDNASTPVNLPAGPAATGTYVVGGAGDLTFNSQLFSSGSFTKIGPGTVTLTNPANAGNYYGTFYVNGGTLRFANAGSFGNTTNEIRLNPTGTVDLNGTSVYKSYTFAGGTLANDNTSTPVTLNYDNFYAYGSPSGNINFGGAGDITLNTYIAAYAIPLVKTGAGTLTLAVAPTTNGAQVLAGTLRLANPNTLPPTGTTSVLPGGTLDLNGSSSSSLSRPVTLAGGALVNNNTTTPVTVSPTYPLSFTTPAFLLGGAGDMTFNGSLSSTQSLTKIGAGTLTLANPNNHTGGTSLLAGTTVFSHDSQLGAFQAPMSITDGLLRNATQATVSRPITLLGSAGGFDTPAPLAVTRPLAGTGALHKYGTSSLTLPSGLNVGPVTVHEGTLVVTQGNAVVTSLSVSPGATFSLGIPRMFIDVAPDAPLPLDSLRSLLLAGRNGGDWLGTGGLTSSRLNPTNDPTRTHAFAYADGSLLPDSYRQIPQFPTGTIPIDTSSILIRYTLYGDTNLDGRIDPDDYALLDRAFAKSLPNPHWTDGDFNYDGQVDQNDYLLIDTTFLSQAQGFSPGFLSTRESQFGADYVSQLLTTIPEPAPSSILYPLSSLLLLPRRRLIPSPAATAAHATPGSGTDSVVSRTGDRIN